MLPRPVPASWPPRPVLIVDPESTRRDAISRMVRGLGYRVRTARTGGDALRAVRQGGVEMGIVLVRAGMKPMDGGEVAERVRDAQPDLTVVLLAATVASGAWYSLTTLQEQETQIKRAGQARQDDLEESFSREKLKGAWIYS